MKIGMVTACYKPVVNGVTRMISLYKTFLSAMGHEVYVFTLGTEDPVGDEPGVIRSPGMPLGDSGYYVAAGYSPEARHLLHEMDIIHCHHLFMSVEMAHRYGRAPIVYTNHTRYDLYANAVTNIPQPAADAIMRQIWPEFTDFADVVITPSESVRRVMLEFGVRRPIEVIENGVDIRPFQNPTHPLTKSDLGLPDDAVLFVYVGRLANEKNLASLISQFAIVVDLFPQAYLLVIGSGPDLDALQVQAAELGIARHVYFTGSVAYPELPDYLAAADVFATASVSEVHPLTVIEAMAAGLPVTAVQSPGIGDIITNGYTGLLTNQPDGGLAAAMTALATNSAYRQQLAENACRDSARFDITHTVNRTVALYERLRETRPDRQREKEHGRWIQNRAGWLPRVGQLAEILRTGEKRGTGPLKWFTDTFISDDEEEHFSP